MNLNETFNWRYATKIFDNNKKISEPNWQTLAESLRMSPSSFGLQPWKFIVVTDQKTQESLVPHSWNQVQPSTCSHYVVFTTLKSIDENYIDLFIEDICKARDLKPEDLAEYKNMMVGSLIKSNANILHWSQKQSYIAMGNLMLTAALLKIDTCPMEGIIPVEYDKIFNLQDTNYTSVAAVALGYRSDEDKYQHLNKVRLDADKIFKYI